MTFSFECVQYIINIFEKRVENNKFDFTHIYTYASSISLSSTLYNSLYFHDIRNNEYVRSYYCIILVVLIGYIGSRPVFELYLCDMLYLSKIFSTKYYNQSFIQLKCTAILFITILWNALKKDTAIVKINIPLYMTNMFTECQALCMYIFST